MRQLVVWVLFGALFATLVVPVQARPIDSDDDVPARCWHRCATEVVEPTALPTQAPATSTPVPTATSVPATATAVPPTATATPRPSATATARPKQVSTEEPIEPTAAPAATSTPQYAATKTFAQTPVTGQTPQQPFASPTGTPVRPIIKSIMPLRVKPGDWVTITGDHFLSNWTQDVTMLMVTYTRVGTNAGGLLAQVYPPYGNVMWEQSAIQFKMPNIPPQEIYISVLAGGFFDTASRALTVEPASTPTPTPTATPVPSPTFTGTNQPRIKLVPSTLTVGRGECFTVDVIMQTFGLPLVTAGGVDIYIHQDTLKITEGETIQGTILVNAYPSEKPEWQKWIVSIIDWGWSFPDNTLGGRVKFCVKDTAQQSNMAILVERNAVNWWPNIPSGAQRVFQNPGTTLNFTLREASPTPTATLMPSATATASPTATARR